MRGRLADVEGLLERAFELPVRRLFRVALQPIELTRAAVRAMEVHRQITARGIQVPNHYRIGLHPQDFRAFASWRETMERELADYLQQYAVQRGWYCPGRPIVELQESAQARAARPWVQCTTVEVAPAVPATLCEPGLPPAPAVVASSPPPTGLPAEAWVQVADAPARPLDRPSVRLGRAPDNDVVVPDAGVSRYHARIDRVGKRFILRDLASSNGTWVNGAPVTEHVLRHGEVFALGKVPVRFWQAR
ncbi:MAG TPA: DUF3662 and FHA domain-containing protein [Chloroflexota bacterium]|jgi:hypothetical protein|nr:DUF3662 and FHA domain-containing protein [Chloroflexota bacterium]